jgi:aminoglycoside/choline kinase family phosphotransferase
LQSLKIELFLKNRIREKISHIIPITNSGSNRSYYRIFTATNSYILTESEFVKENKSFIYFADLFNKSEVNVPIVIAVNEDFTIYLQEDIGDSSLLNVLLNEGFSDYAYKLYQNSLSQLAKLQIHTKGIIDYEKCYDFQAFNNQQVLNDLFYFKDFFVERLNIPYKKSQLIAEFFQISEKIKSFESDFFLYRDFQARNIFKVVCEAFWAMI